MRDLSERESGGNWRKRVAFSRLDLLWELKKIRDLSERESGGF